MKIKSISEAYSIEPRTMHVIPNDFCQDKLMDVERIELETITQGSPAVGNAFMAYVGYNYYGQKLFTFKADSVNVEYFPSDNNQ